MKIIEVPEELKVRARLVLYMEPAIQNVIRSLTQEIVKNHFEVVALWRDVGIEMAKQGISQGEGEIATYDHITGIFAIVPREPPMAALPQKKVR